jgi:hypothetical protein
MPHVGQELLTGLLRIKQKANSLFYNTKGALIKIFSDAFLSEQASTAIRILKNIKKTTHTVYLTVLLGT